MTERRVVRIVQDGQTFAGGPCYFLDSDDGMDRRGERELEPDCHMAGFFHSEDEARKWAEANGFTVEE